MRPVADAITQYPVTHLHLYPNLLEHPKYIVSIPMMTVKWPTQGAVIMHKRVAFMACSSSVNPSHRRGWGGDAACPYAHQPYGGAAEMGMANAGSSIASSVGSMAVSAINNLVGAVVPKVELQPSPPSGRWQSGIG
ncbi:hypothetical protein Vretifemale_12780 [Volvox reticuliferus]|uniref:Uncharacterized protein n=1 Tax=Volvox reticuliferus TaxID=1737510 RepID=A0A8J4CPJ5_9CHLO|nr:hypothetical protein Vretifemale_12780 [Volvox reticuliferus]